MTTYPAVTTPKFVHNQYPFGCSQLSYGNYEYLFQAKNLKSEVYALFSEPFRFNKNAPECFSWLVHRKVVMISMLIVIVKLRVPHGCSDILLNSVPPACLALYCPLPFVLQRGWKWGSGWEFPRAPQFDDCTNCIVRTSSRIFSCL